MPWNGDSTDAMSAKVQGKADVWDNSVKQARQEFKSQGKENPNDQTKGYTERINELYNGNPKSDTAPDTAINQPEMETMSPHRKDLEAISLAYEQAHKEWDSAGKSKKDRGVNVAFFDRLRELYHKNCAELGIEPKPGSFSQEGRDAWGKG